MADRQLNVLVRFKEERNDVLARLQASLKGVDATVSVLGKNAAQSANGLSAFQKHAIGLNQALELIGKASRLVQTGFREVVSGFAHDAIEIDNLARRFEVPIEEMSKLSILAKEAEVEVSDLGPAFRKVTDAVAQAVDPLSKFGKFFRDGLKFNDADIKRLELATPLERLISVVEAFKGIQAGAIKSSAEMEVFGAKSVGAMRQFVQETGNVRKAKDELSGAEIITAQDVARAQEFDHAFELLARSVKALKNELGRSGVLEAVIKGVDQLTASLRSPEAVAAAHELGVQIGKFTSAAIEGIPKVIAAFATFATFLRDHIALVTNAAALWVSYKAAMITVGILQGIAKAYGIVSAAVGILSAALGLNIALQAAVTAGVSLLAAGAAFLAAKALLAKAGLDGVSGGIQGMEGDARSATDAIRDMREAMLAASRVRIGPLGDLRLQTSTAGVLTGLEVEAAEAAAEAAKGRALTTDPFGKGGAGKIDEFNRKLADLKAKLAEATGAAKPFDAAVRDILKDFDKFPGAEKTVRPIAEALVRAQEAAATFDTDVREAMEAMREPTALNVQLLTELRDGLASLPVDPGTEKALKAIRAQLGGMIPDLQKASEEMEKGLRRQIEEARDPTSVLRHEMDEAVEAGKKLGNVNIGPLTAQLQQAKKEAGAFFSAMGAVDDIIEDVGNALISGTRGKDWAQVGEGIKLSLGRSLVSAFSEGMKAKLGFDKDFKINIVGLMKNAGEVLTGNRGLGAIFENVFKGVIDTTTAGTTQVSQAFAVIPSALEDAAKMSSVALHGIPVEATAAFSQTAAVAQQGALAVGNAAGTATSMWGQFFSFLLSTASSAFGGLISLAGGAISAIARLLGGLGSSAGGVLSAIAGGASRLLGGAASGGGNIVSGIIDVAKTVLGTGGVISKGITAVGNIFSGSTLARTASGIFGTDGSIARVFGSIKSAVASSKIGPLVSSLGSLVGVIGGGFAAFHGVMTLFSKRASGLQRALGGLESIVGLSTAFTSLQKLVPAFGRFATNIAAAGSSSLNVGGGAVGLTDFVRGFASQAGFKQLTTALGTLPRLLVETLGRLIPNVIKTALQGAYNAIRPAIQAVLQIAAQQGAVAVGATGAEGATLLVQQAGQQGGSSLLGNLALPVAVIGALYSIAKGIQGVFENTAVLRKVEHGDAAAGRAGVIQGVHLAATTAIGAVVGTLIAPGIGTIIGAGIGAAVGTIVNAQLTKIIASITANAQRGGLAPGVSKQEIRQGISQEQFGSQMKEGLRSDTLLNVLSAYGGNQIFTALLGGLVTPDLDKIFDKIFTEVITKALPGKLINRQLGESLGQGVVGPKRRESLDAFRPERREDGTVVRAAGVLRSDTRGTAALVSGLIGAGSENVERIARFTNILANNLASGKKSSEALRDELYKIVRSVTGNLLTGLSAVNVLFEGGAKRAERTRKEVDLVARSFQKVIPTVNLPAITKAAQRDTGGVDVQQVRRGVRTDLLGDVQRGEIELTKKVTRNFGDVFTDVVRRLRERVKDIDVLGIAIRVAAESVRPKGGFVRELERELRSAVLVAAQAGTISVEQVKTDAKALGDGFLLVAAKLQEKVGPAVDVFALAAAEAGDKMRKAVKNLASDVKIQMALVLKALPTLAPEEVAQVSETFKRNQRGRVRSPRGRRRAKRTADVVVEGIATIRQSLDALALRTAGLGSVASAAQAGRQALAARTGLTTAIESLPTLGPKKRKEQLAQIPQFVQQAIEAFEAINEVVADLTEQLRDARSQAEDFAFSTQELIDGLRGTSTTSALYATALRENEATLRDLAAAGGSAAEQLELVTREMDLLQRQASAEIQGIQNIAEAQKKVHQTRLDAIDKELEGLSRLAGLAESLADAVSNIRTAGITSPFRKVESGQQELARQRDIFRTTTGDEQAAAAERIIRLSEEQLRAASDAFGPASAEFASVQRDLLAGIEPIEKIAREAAKRSETLLADQKLIQADIKAIDERTETAIGLINLKLADQLAVWRDKAIPLFEQRDVELKAQLVAALAVQTQARDHLSAIVTALNKLAGITDTTTAAGPTPVPFTGRQELQFTGQVFSTRAQGLKPGETLNAGVAKDIPGLLGAYLPGGRFFDALTQLAKQAGTTNFVSADIAALNIAISKHANGAPWTKGDLDSVQRLLKDLLKQVGGAEPRARGGPVAAGRPYIVGEHGPEIVIPKQAATVIDHRNTKEVLRVIQKQAPAPALRLVGTTVSRALPPSRTRNLLRQAAAVVAAIGLAAGVARTSQAAIRPSVRGAVPVERVIQGAVRAVGTTDPRPTLTKIVAQRASLSLVKIEPLALRQQITQALNLGQQRPDVLSRALQVTRRPVRFPVGTKDTARLRTVAKIEPQLQRLLGRVDRAPIALRERQPANLASPTQRIQLGLGHALTSVQRPTPSLSLSLNRGVNLFSVLRRQVGFDVGERLTRRGANLGRDAARRAPESRAALLREPRQLAITGRALLRPLSARPDHAIRHALTSLPTGTRANLVRQPLHIFNEAVPSTVRSGPRTQLRNRLFGDLRAPLPLGANRTGDVRRQIVRRLDFLPKVAAAPRAVNNFLRDVFGRGVRGGAQPAVPRFGDVAIAGIVRASHGATSLVSSNRLANVGGHSVQLASKTEDRFRRLSKSVVEQFQREPGQRRGKQEARLGLVNRFAHGSVLPATRLPHLTPVRLPHLATGGVMKRDAVVQLHKQELVLPLSSKTALTQVGSAIARAIVTAKPTVGEPITRRNVNRGSDVVAGRSSATSTAQGGGTPPKIEINVTVQVQPAKGESLARAQLFGRTAANALEAELMKSQAFGALGRRVRAKVR